MSEQLYLLRISAMSTCDECDIVPSAEIIIDSDLGTEHLPVIATLHALVRKLSKTLQDAPLDNIRPMNRKEIQCWRDDAE